MMNLRLSGFKAWRIPVVFIFDGSGKLVAAVHPGANIGRALGTALQGQIPNVEAIANHGMTRGSGRDIFVSSKELQEKFSEELS